LQCRAHVPAAPLLRFPARTHGTALAALRCMVVTISLVAADDSDTIEVSRTVDVRADGDAWQTALVGAIGDHARETALCLAQQLAPALPEASASFTLLKDLLAADRPR
jgi:hypothetical protein